MKDVVIMDLTIEDREEEEVKTKGDFDPDVASMRSKMGKDEEELEEETLLFPIFKTPRKIIDEFRAHETKTVEEAASAKTGTKGTTQGGQPKETVLRGKEDTDKTRVDNDDNNDSMSQDSVASQAA